LRQALKNTPPREWPPNAGKLFLEVLRNRRAAASDRLVAAELAGDLIVINDEGVEVLLSIVISTEESEQLRAKAVISLGPILEQADTDGFEDDLVDVPITEDTFHNIQESLRKLYADATVPKEVRRRILEASVRAPEDWHEEAIRTAWSGSDEEWKLTAAFCMGSVRGFDDQILEALDSSNPDIHYEAVRAAGNWSIDAAWPHVTALLTSRNTRKPLLLAAIEAVAFIRAEEAGPLLVDLADSGDEEIAEAALDAMEIAETRKKFELDDEDDV
jgi:hypothetical protein